MTDGVYKERYELPAELRTDDPPGPLRYAARGAGLGALGFLLLYGLAGFPIFYLPAIEVAFEGALLGGAIGGLFGLLE